MRSQRLHGPRRGAQRGTVAIMFALSLVVLMGFAGLALDGARLYINKAELQNAADACALAAAQSLPPTGAIAPATFEQARDAGLTVAMRNSVDLQSSAVTAGVVTVEFSTAPTGAAWAAAGGAPNNARYARCRVAPEALALWFMPVLGTGTAKVAAQAAATRDTPNNNCALRPGGPCDQVASLVQ